MAFVLETEARLDGIRQARAEITGTGTDAEALGGRLAAMSVKSKAAFEAMSVAEQKAFLGFVGIKEGASDAAKAAEDHARATDKDTQAIERSAIAMLRARDAQRASISSPLAAMNQGMSGPAFGPSLPPGGLIMPNYAVNPAFVASARRLKAENDAVAQSFDPVSGKARTAANAMSTLSFQAAGLTAGGQSTVIAMGSLTSSLAHLSSNAALAAGASGIGALVVIAATLIPLMSKLRDESERVAGGFAKAFGGGDEANAGMFLRLAQQRRRAAEDALANAPSALSPLQRDLDERKNRQAALAESVTDEQAAIQAVFAARHSAERKAKEDAKQFADERARDTQRAEDMISESKSRAAIGSLRLGSPEQADVLGANVDAQRKGAEIDKMNLSVEEKARAHAAVLAGLEADTTRIHDEYADKRIAKSDEESRKQDAIDKAAAKKKLDTAKANVDAIVRTEGSVLQTMKRLALEPIIDRLEGIAAQQAVEALASFPDLGAMAAHGAAAIAATAAARQVAGWAGSGTRGGGGAGSSAGGGSGAGTFEPRSGTEGQGMVTINLLSQNPYGAEQIQQVSYLLQRREILRRPIPIGPTNQLLSA